MRWKNVKPKVVILMIVISIFGMVLGGCSNDKNKSVGLFYTVEKDGRETVIGGTIHVGKEEIEFQDSVMKKFNKAEIIAVEIDTSDMNLLQQAFQDMYYQNGEKLIDGMSEEGKNIIKDKVDKLSLPLEAYETLKPMYFNQMVVSEYLKGSEYKEEYGMESQLILRAYNLRKKTESIEKLEHQTRISAIGSKEDQEKYYIHSLKNYESASNKEAMDFMYNTILQGDLKSLQEGIKKFEEESAVNYEGISEEFFKEYEKAMLSDRNIYMADRVEEFISSDRKYFSLVGAAHLYGEEGVLRLLEKRGYKVTQIK